MSTERRLLLSIALLLGAAASARADDAGLIQVYPGHGRPDAFVLTGRFIEDEGVRRGNAATGRWRNALDNLRRLESDEIAGALIELEVDGRRFQATTDRDGVWRVHAAKVEPPLPAGVLTVTARTLRDRGHPAAPARGVLHVLPPGPTVAVLSDIDDTVVITGVTSKRKMLKNALLSNAAQLAPVPGIAGAYRSAQGAGARAFFYLSGSPQNFLDRILEYLRLHQFPAGPVLLKNFGSDPTFDQEGYKLGRIREVLDMHPGTRFVLVGDSGEKDPEIYLRIRGEHPDRIAGIVIRKVPEAVNGPERFRGIVVVDDFTAVPDVVARLVQEALSIP